MAEMPVKECGDLAKHLLGLGQAIVELVLSVRLTLVDFELRRRRPRGPGSAPRSTQHPKVEADSPVRKLRNSQWLSPKSLGKAP